MKKLVNIFLIFNLCFCLFAETITIDTSKGPTELIVPETIEDLREAFIEMSKIYVEERYAHEDLIEAFEKVNLDFEDLKMSKEEMEKSLDSYIQNNELLRTQYNKLSEDYNDLIETMNKRIKTTPIQGLLSVELNFTDNFKGTVPAVELGAYLFEKVMITTRVSYPWELGLAIGFTF